MMPRIGPVCRMPAATRTCVRFASATGSGTTLFTSSMKWSRRATRNLGGTMLSRRLTAILGATAVGLLAGAIPAAASGGEIGGSGSQYHLTNGWEAKTDLHFTYGRQNDAVYVGDWDGDGIDTLAVRRSATYHFRNELSGGDADEVTTYRSEEHTSELQSRGHLVC